jgi:hypothetical protein
LLDDHHAPNIAGMEPEDKVEAEVGDGQLGQSFLSFLSADMIPGLDVELLAETHQEHSVCQTNSTSTNSTHNEMRL